MDGTSCQNRLLAQNSSLQQDVFLQRVIDIPLSSDDSDLSSASYDGSHLPWRRFRQEVLAPHQTRNVDGVPKDRIPSPGLQIVEAANQDTPGFGDRKNCFWNRVTTSRGFGPSPIFPPNLLPPFSSGPLYGIITRQPRSTAEKSSQAIRAIV